MNGKTRMIARREALFALLACSVAGTLLPLAAHAATCEGGFLCNPVGVASISEFIQKVLVAMVRLGSVVVALFILIAGFMFVSARGNSHQLAEAKENFKYVMLGAVLILGAWVIATVIAGTVTQILGR